MTAENAMIFHAHEETNIWLLFHFLWIYRQI